MIRPGPLWTMLAAVWAFVLLGGAPQSAREALCGTGPVPAHHDAGCILCCTCTTAVTIHAIPAPAAALPLPGFRVLAVQAAPWPPGTLQGRAAPVRATGPPGVA